MGLFLFVIGHIVVEEKLHGKSVRLDIFYHGFLARLWSFPQFHQRLLSFPLFPNGPTYSALLRLDLSVNPLSKKRLRSLFIGLLSSYLISVSPPRLRLGRRPRLETCNFVVGLFVRWARN